jgi:hypothetical protein
MVVKAIEDDKDDKVLADAKRIGGYGEGETPKDAAELAGRLLTTVYMGTEVSSDLFFNPFYVCTISFHFH